MSRDGSSAGGGDAVRSSAGGAESGSDDGSEAGAAPLSASDFHVLLVLAEGASYGYAIMKAVEAHSGGAVAPEIGSMYRVLSRLMSEGWVQEVGPPAGAPTTTRGRERRYYGLTPEGRRAARAEARRLAAVLDLARSRDLLAEGGRG